MQNSLNAASAELADVLQIQSSISVGSVPHLITEYDALRWLATMTLMGLLILVGLMAAGCGRFGSE